MLQALKRFFGSSADGENADQEGVSLRVIPRDEHPISRSQISENALKVLYRLQNSEHEAYLVGGGVRDIMVGIPPKDFDVVTDATPERVRELFRNSRIIGRRFKIVHVLFGREVIEVATYRTNAPEEVEEDHVSDSGRLLRDNVYGTLEDDVMRRDFTINAMYYTPRDFSLVTLPQSMVDLEKRTIRMIGDPEQRYREDPVRMLRAVRFAAKLDFSIDPDTAEPIARLASLLRDVPPARLFDDVLKLFMNGYAVATWDRLSEYGLLQHLFPETCEQLDAASDDHYHRLIRAALESTDKRIARGKSVTPAFLYAAFLWPVVVAHAAHNRSAGLPPIPAQQQAAQEAIRLQSQHTSVPKRFQMTMRDIWDLQLRLPNRQGDRAERLMSHPKFRAAFDFLQLREAAGEDLGGLGQWWEDFQHKPERRSDLIKKAGGNGRRSGGRRRRKRSS